MTTQMMNVVGESIQEAQSGEWLPVYDPARGEPYATCPRSDVVDINDAVAAGHRALAGEWGRLTHSERATLLHRVADNIELRSSELVDVEVEDTGKPRWLVEMIDSRALATELRTASQLVAGLEDTADQGRGSIGLTMRLPFGVVGLLLPWNFPAVVFAEKLAPIIAAGNVVVVKPSEATPASATLAARLLVEAGLPPGVVNVVHGLGSEVGHALVKHPDIRRISFTGRTTTGRSVAAAGAAALKSVSLELSGKNPFIVCEDADLRAAARAAALSCFFNTGQLCTSGALVEVHVDVRKEFLDFFLAEVAALRVGAPDDPNAHLGPIIEERHFQTVKSYLKTSDVDAARLFIGEVPTGLPGWYAPPVVTEPSVPDHPLLIDEVFGPIATVNTFTDLDDVMARMRRSEYGLASFVWTRDLGRVGAFLAGADSGRIWVNTAHSIPPGMTLPPWKNSGLGVEGGREGLLSFMRLKTANIGWQSSGVAFPSPPSDLPVAVMTP